MKLPHRLLLLTCLVFVISGVCVCAQTSTSYDTLVQQGNLKLQAGNNEQALSTANSAIKLSINRWEAYALAGGALMNLKRYEEAADQFGHAIDHAPQTKQAGLRELRKQCLLAETGVSPSTASTPATVPAQPTATTQAEIVLWKTIQDSKNVDDFQAYLQQYPNGAFVVLAKNHLGKLYGDLGVAQLNSGNYTAAAASYEKACDAGKADFCKALGFMYDNGRFVAQNLSLAVHFAQMGCDGGDMEGCSNLGVAYDNGRGVTQDHTRAVQLFQKACDGGADGADGCLDLGSEYSNGIGVTKDTTRAAQLYEKACDGGKSQGCNSLGIAYDNGIGVAKDNVRAVQLFQKACDGGDANGCRNLGILNDNGWGVTQDHAHAAQLYQKACDGGDANGCSNLGFTYDNGQGVAHDNARAKQFYQKACTLGMTSACGK